MAKESEDDQRRPGRSKWKRRQEISLKKKDALRRDKWRDVEQAIAEGMRCIWPSLLRGQHQIKTE